MDEKRGQHPLPHRLGRFRPRKLTPLPSGRAKVISVPADARAADLVEAALLELRP